MAEGHPEIDIYILESGVTKLDPSGSESIQQIAILRNFLCKYGRETIIL